MADHWQLRIAFIAQNINIACLTLCLYEYACTLSTEVTFIWKAPWNIPKVLYLAARYPPFVVLPALVYLHQFQCESYQRLLPWPAKVCICVCESIFALRTWAVWNRNRNITIFFFIFFPTLWTTVFVLLGLSTIRQDPNFPGLCRSSSASPPVLYGLKSFHLFIDFCLIFLFYCVVITLSSIKAYQHCIKNPGTSFLRLVHLDGVLYYICCLSFSLVIMIFLGITAVSELDTVASMLVVLHLTAVSVLSCRTLLRLREHGSHTMRGIGTQEYPSGFTMHMDPLVFLHDDLDLET
ncbi:hypothetical protein FPV67DRAFT_781398 [Lyophyllum atratum]|nr:hypothetical protein FPV67DRAFT_781398 [Lyophyllum atratum]